MTHPSSPSGAKLVAGNWKMNGTRASLVELDALKSLATQAGHPDLALPGARLVVCPPATLVAAAAERLAGTAAAVGGQDCHAQASGAFTGDIAAGMLADAGASYVIVGHSERRTLHGEDDATVRAKAEAALQAGLTPIVCVGESEAERDAGQTLAVIARQVRDSVPQTEAALVIAYEPVWAIGTGRTPTNAQIVEVHTFIHGAQPGRPVLYGGSVKPQNAAEILALSGVDGALVGGASLKAADFWAIAAAARA
ncbi:triose-phosphate isomerase [Zavarzinia sp. CC-PAN008]|uniref:triose-phosphate isomerase n=1 Tax=Zavarzinia sp. CC-PAN008 TaxID=3243332 RepID=UPI003F747C85